MSTYTLTSREIPHDNTYDVIVCGGGPAGCASAIAAARHGAKTLLIEANYSLGGMSTLGMVPTWCPYTDKEKVIYKGIAEEILEAEKLETPCVPKEKLDWVQIDPEPLKRIYDDLLEKAGADVLFGTFISDVDVNDGVINAVIVSNKNGLSAYSAKVYIDCTGDADVAYRAGAECVYGDGEGNAQAATHCFELGGVNEKVYVSGVNMHNANSESPIHKIVNDGKYPELDDVHFCQSLIRPNTVGFNAGHIWNVNSTDAKSISDSMRIGRRKAYAYSKALKDYYPEAFSNAFVNETAPLMGIRESRRVIGDYILTKDDYIDRKTFPDEIERNSYYLDIHMSKEEQEKTGHKSLRYSKGESHGIPYRCLTPKGLKNLLVAGRSISTDRAVQGSTRVMPVCFVTGQAAGTAAFIAAKQKHVNVHEVDVHLLRKTLADDGAYFN